MPLVDGVIRFSVSENGTLAYVAARSPAEQLLVWVDREGEEIGRVGSPGLYRNPELSPDGTRLAVVSNCDVGVYDLERGVSNRVTFDGQDVAAV